MAIFKIEKNVPDIYVRESRDFQLFCSLFELMQNGVKFDIDSIQDITNTELCSSRLLNLLQSKLGLVTSKPMTERNQRIILSAFPYLLKYKGSRIGIYQALYAFLKTLGIRGEVKVDINNKDSLYRLDKCYVVEIFIDNKRIDTTLLDDILKYIIPAGYIVDYYFGTSSKLKSVINFNDDGEDNDRIKIIFVRNEINSSVRNPELNYNNDNNIMAVGTAEVLNSDKSMIIDEHIKHATTYQDLIEDGTLNNDVDDFLIKDYNKEENK